MGFFTRSKKKPTLESSPSSGDQSVPPNPSQVPQPQWHPNDRQYATPAPRQPAGYLVPPPPLPPPPCWSTMLPSGPASPPQYQNQQQYLPIVVNQHYYLSPSAPHQPAVKPYPHSNGACTVRKLKLSSTANLADQVFPGNMGQQILNDGLPRWHAYGTQVLNQSAAMYDQICSSFNDVMTLIDRDKYIGNENDLFTYQSHPVPPSSTEVRQQTVVHKGPAKKAKKGTSKDAPKGQTNAITSSLASRGYFAKVELYANSKLSSNLTPLRLHIPTYPLVCLAAQYSERVYENPRGAERDAHFDADWRTGAKAMRIKSVPMDHMETIVFAIRGTATFMDWSVNLNTAPTAPKGFLDDPNNFCHAGFLSVARKMIPPVAARLRHLLEEDPRRCSYSLLITGHSAGGAVASLLYAHMLSTSKAASSELNSLTGCFKRVHCITFGTPPVSLFPLQKPSGSEFKKSVFLTFVNEGDPVARADKAYVKSLLELLVAPAPVEVKETGKHPPPSKGSSSKHGKTHGNGSDTSLISKTSKASAKSGRSSSHASPKLNKPKAPGPIWNVPPSTLSNAGQIVVLRSGNPSAKAKRVKTVEERLKEGVVAQVATDEQLRGLIWGDPVCHVMKLYIGRVELLAVEAVTARGY
ncbi:alpha/beta-hydrolase [Daldinia caldariorum]|uniref:alpha/beta-hydrolase n=1 Tax=Daldinia caldariorum TaxID=326644 RepID=UPI002008DCEA|nr:alpha/beta-hydrolase [Daldinia caldariorum]KAI1464457.1 alpha/beta-hydrolase [Daldinia caldariorum]